MGEYSRSGALPDWMEEFAIKELKKGGNPFDDIKEIFKSKDDLNAIEACVEELKKRVGLDQLEKHATIKEVERAKEHGKGKTKKWCVYPKNGGKALGCHPNRASAERQLKAIEISKAMHADDLYIQEVEDEVLGGLGDNQPDERFDKDQLEKGIKVELEHTNNPQLAKEITKDHLQESKDFKDQKGGKYYDKLDGMEEEIKDELTKASQIINLIVLANYLEKEGFLHLANKVDKKIAELNENLANDKKPKILEKYKGLDKFIQNACRTCGGHNSIPAILDRIHNEFDKEIDIQNDSLKEFIEKCLEENKEDLNKDNEHAGEYVAIIITDDDDGNKKMFREPNGIN